ncbi:microviridin/marinostatin family tricyclic proteinase inhibitor [Fischerella sp. PCC 9605]|uniref:microviridin/marinostatin family tricyclic proteinase inhibitor n=1 Tax=Fischerella sp. PCC 9605 TaxID=1173024 RepID=UPI0007C559BB|nr:microviridin/marinostatin family tricyclic proteinase inhibitor [Fischerella sp. PCC 9605]
MSNSKKQDLNLSVVPFFARYLEGQLCEDLSSEEMEKITGGSEVVTMRYPSDNEDSNPVPMPPSYPTQPNQPINWNLPSYPHFSIPIPPFCRKRK